MPQRPRKGLESSLHDVVRVAPRQLAHVQGDASCVGQALEEVLHQLGLEAADALRGNLQAVAQVGPPRQVLRARPGSSMGASVLFQCLAGTPVPGEQLLC